MSSHKIQNFSFGLQVGCKFFEISSSEKCECFLTDERIGFSNPNAVTVALSKCFPAGNVTRHFDFK